MTKKEHHVGIFGLAIAALAIIALWLLNRSGLLHEAVSSKIVTPQGTIMSDPATGVPQYDPRDQRTVPETEAFAQPAIINPSTNQPVLQAPIGYQTWRNAMDGNYYYLPVAVQ